MAYSSGIKTKPFIRIPRQLNIRIVISDDFELALPLTCKYSSVSGIFISVHKAEGHRSASYESHRQDVIVSQHSSTSRFVLSPVNTFNLVGIVSIPYKLTLVNLKSSYLKLVLYPFHKGEAGVLLSTINAP